MTTQEKSKQVLLAEMREKREAKKQAKIRAKRRTKTAAIVTLVALVTVTLGTVFNASAKEITITEINEFAGVNETKTVRTRGENIEDVLEEHGLDIAETDKINVPTEKEVEDNEDIVITRGKRVTIKVGDYQETVTVTKADAAEALVEAGYIPGEHDRISTSDDTLDHGDTIELVSISHTDEVTTEKIERGIDYVDDPSMMQGQERVVDEGYDGEKEIAHKVTYQDGAEASRETLSENVILEPKNRVIARGTATPAPKKKKSTVSETLNTKSTVNDNGGYVNGYKYKKKITMTATAYSTSASENGGYSTSAMGNPLGFGIVAVDPKVVPLGSKVYVTSPDGSWTYGVASAEDTGGAIKGNKIDLCFNSNARSFGRRSCVVYILE